MKNLLNNNIYYEIMLEDSKIWNLFGNEWVVGCEKWTRHYFHFVFKNLIYFCIILVRMCD